jgi:hypothetical protein
LNSEGQSESNSDLRRYEALLEMADLIVQHHELPELFSAMAERLHELVTAEVAHFSLYNPTNNTMQEIRTELNFEEIVGDTPALKKVLAQARTVANQ